ncbi:MAG TPA: 2-oxoacid:ferredoxin oxidoreductase subunit beta, partial [Casimicrobiaceae bacterium]
PSSKVTAMTYLESRRERGEVVTGLLYVHPDSGDMHDALGTVDAPLNTLSDADLVPGSAALAALNASLR